MGRELVGDRQSLDGGGSEDFAPVSILQIFLEHLPFYLSIGMSPKDFWEGDCYLTKAYREAYKLRTQEKNRELWLQGLYVYEAIMDVAPVLHAFAKRGTKPREYLNEPIALTEEEIRERKEREEKRRFEDMKARMTAWAAQQNIKLAQQAQKEVRANE